MRAALAVLRRALRHRHTTAVGLSMIAGAVAATWADPRALTAPWPWLMLLNGLGFVLSADGGGGGNATGGGALPA